jgi:hypothetical protein
VAKSKGSIGYRLAMEYVSLHKANGVEYTGNINSDSWSLKAMAEVMGSKEVRDLMNYYFDVYGFHDSKWFIYNYGKVSLHRQLKSSDRKNIADLKEATRRKMNER